MEFVARSPMRDSALMPSCAHDDEHSLLTKSTADPPMCRNRSTWSAEIGSEVIVITTAPLRSVARWDAGDLDEDYFVMAKVGTSTQVFGSAH